MAHVLVYDLKTLSLMSHIPEEDVRALVLVLDAESAMDERSLPAGVSRGWGNTDLRLITGGTRIKVWNLPYR